LEIVTEGNEGNQDSCRNHLAFFTEGDEGNWNPCGTVGFLQKRTKARKEQAKLKLPFPYPEFFTEANEGRSGPSKIQSLFSSLSFV
jgi:hypothetical protein